MGRSRAIVGYGAGDWFAMPLEDGSFAPGRVAVHAGDHLVLCYLFAPVDHLPTLDEVVGLDPGDALCARVMSGLRIGSPWPMLGGAGPVDLDVWRLPEGENNLSHVFPPERAVRVEIRDAYLRTAHSFHVPLSELGTRQPGGVAGADAVPGWYLHVLKQGALVPVRNQPWWDSPTQAPTSAPPPPPSELEDRVRIVVPGPGRAAAEVIESALLRELDPGAGELDGMMGGPEGHELTLYGPDGRHLAVEVERIVCAQKLPVGSHMKVEAGDASWTVPLTT